MRLRGYALSLALSLASPATLALRPYDGTDAAVAPPREFEIELGPVGRLREGDRTSRVAPALIVNYGLSSDRELVIQGQREVANDPEPGQARSSIVENGIFVKQVLKAGVLQDRPGLSMATEYGVLLPGVHDQHGTGVSVAAIVSQRTEAFTAHLNGALALNRDHEPGVFLGVIVEGPYAWRIRPVAEIFGDKASGSSGVTSGLVGAIWRASDNLAFDLGVRAARAGSESIRELRLGLTWSFELADAPRRTP